MHRKEDENAVIPKGLPGPKAKGATKFCSGCERDISKSKFRRHFLPCTKRAQKLRRGGREDSLESVVMSQGGDIADLVDGTGEVAPM